MQDVSRIPCPVEEEQEVTPAKRCASPPALRQVMDEMGALLSFLARQYYERDGRS